MTKVPNPKPGVAAFDFDGTVTYSDTLFFFFLFTNGVMKTIGKLVPKIPRLVGYILGHQSRQGTKEKLLASFFAGKSIAEMRELGQQFAAKKLPELVKPEALERIKWHKSRGHRCVLISASLDVYLEPWAKSVGFEDIVSSHFEIDKAGKISGQLNGLNCWGPEKTRRLLELLGPKENYMLYAYGDSKGDKDLLALADFPFYRSFS